MPFYRQPSAHPEPPADEKNNLPVPVVLIFLTAALYISFSRADLWLNKWVYTHWLFSYEFGPLKRGLAGQILVWLDIAPTYQTVHRIGIGLLAAIFGAAGLLMLRGFSGRSQTGWLLFCLALIASPATLQHVANSVSRVNDITVLLQMVFLLLLPFMGRAASTVLLVGASCASLAVHEGSLFLTIPLMVAAYVHVYKAQRGTVAMAAAASLLVAGFFVWLAMAHARLGLTQQAFLDHVNSLMPRVHQAAVRILFTDIRENLRTTLDFAWTWSNLVHHLIFAIVIAPVVVPLGIACKGLVRAGAQDTDLPWTTGLLLLAALSPLALYPIGLDHFRWLSASLLNLFLAILVLCWDPVRQRIVAEAFLRRWHWVLASAAMGWIAGPAADFYSFSWARMWLGTPP